MFEYFGVFVDLKKNASPRQDRSVRYTLCTTAEKDGTAGQKTNDSPKIFDETQNYNSKFLKKYFIMSKAISESTELLNYWR